MVETASLREKYNQKKGSTKGRVDKNGESIQFLLSFDEYCKLWKDRGLFPSKPWCISRVNDLGNYEVGNVYISTCRRNNVEATPHKSDDHLITDFAMLYKMSRTTVRRCLKNGTLTLDFIKDFMKGKSILDTKYE